MDNEAAAADWLSRVQDKATAKEILKLRPTAQKIFDTAEGESWRASKFLQTAVAKQLAVDIDSFRGTLRKQDG